MKKKFTIIELFVSITIISILISILIPSLANARQMGKRAVCLSSQKHISIASQLYVIEENYFPALAQLKSGGGLQWWDEILGLEQKWIQCPSVKIDGIGYNHPSIGGWLGPGPNFNEVFDPTNTVIFADSSRIINHGEPNPDKWVAVDSNKGENFFRTPVNNPWYSSQGQRIIGRHAGSLSAVFVDGHGQTMKASGLGMQYSEGHELAKWDLK